MCQPWTSGLSVTAAKTGLGSSLGEHSCFDLGSPWISCFKSMCRKDPVLQAILLSDAKLPELFAGRFQRWTQQPRLATATLSRLPWRHALALLQAMQELKIKINAYHCNAVLKALPWQQQAGLLLDMAAIHVAKERHLSLSSQPKLFS